MWRSVALVSESVGVFPLIYLFPCLSHFKPQIHICCSSVFHGSQDIHLWITDWRLTSLYQRLQSSQAALQLRSADEGHVAPQKHTMVRKDRQGSKRTRTACTENLFTDNVHNALITSSLSLAQQVDFNIFVAIPEISCVNPKRDFKTYILAIPHILSFCLTPQNQVKC